MRRKPLRTQCVRWICVLTLIVGASEAAQERSWVAVPHPMVMLLRDESVHQELDLGAEQIEAVGTLLDAVDVRLWRLRDPVDDKRAEKVAALLGSLETAVRHTLSSRQWRRLEQLVLQAEGIGGILREDRAVRLKLRKDQVQRIGERVRQTEQSLAALGPGRAEAPEAAVHVQRVRAALERDVLNTLDGSQHQAFGRLVGPAFDLSRVRRRACRAPEFENVTQWLNAEPLSLASLRGQVVVVHFYCYGCINCVRNLPHYNAWWGDSGERGLRVVGIHRPETKGEHDIDRVRQKVREQSIAYPVAVDNDSTNWELWANHTWPSVYLVDKQGFVRYWWYGELNWQGIEGERWFRQRIKELLREQ